MNLRSRTILWRRLDTPGHEAARVFLTKSQWTLVGTAIFLHDSQVCRINYRLKCDSQWRTLSAKIDGWMGSQSIGVTISVDSDNNWHLNTKQCADVSDCMDLDFSFSPITNTVPIRCLKLAVGQCADVRAACLKFPSLTLEPLAQLYQRNGTSTYRFERGGDRVAAQLGVDKAGLVIHYPGFWQVEDP